MQFGDCRGRNELFSRVGGDPVLEPLCFRFWRCRHTCPDVFVQYMSDCAANVFELELRAWFSHACFEIEFQLFRALILDV